MEIEFVEKMEKETEIIIPPVPFVVNAGPESYYLVTREDKTHEFILTVLGSGIGKKFVGHSFYDDKLRDDNWMKENLRQEYYKICNSKILIEKPQ